MLKIREFFMAVAPPFSLCAAPSRAAHFAVLACGACFITSRKIPALATSSSRPAISALGPLPLTLRRRMPPIRLGAPASGLEKLKLVGNRILGYVQRNAGDWRISFPPDIALPPFQIASVFLISIPLVDVCGR